MRGQRLGAYLIDRELGSGGMGTVYRATRGTETVALKVVHAHLLESDDAVERFRREIAIGKSVRHPNVVRTLDGGEADGRCFLAMELVEGQTLQGLLTELGRVPEELCRHIAIEVTKGLSAIHAAGAIHRDIKPENVLITPSDEVKIMDLGVARMVDEALRLSQTGAFVGSLRYAAPECFRPALGAPDHRVDLHALGLVLYELSTGVAPYAAADVHSSILRVLEEIPSRVGERNPQVSPFFEEAVHTLLVKDPRGRFAAAADLLVVLEEGERGSWWQVRARAMRRESRRPLRRIRIPRETAIHGRDDELAALHDLFAAVRSGDGRVLLLDGEAGIGKSRLVDEFVAQLERDATPVEFLFGGYPPGGAATASAAFTTAYREQFGEAGSGSHLRGNQVLVPAFDALLRGEPAPPGAERLDKAALQTCFVRSTQSMARDAVVVILIEDLHFAPEEGLALFTSLALGIRGHRVLLIGTTRRSLSEEWRSSVTSLGHAAQMSLPRLGAKVLVELLEEALGSRHLAVELGGKIAVQSDGNPFFAFELLRGLREGSFLTQTPDGSWITTRVIDDLEIPASVRDLVAARVSALGDEDRDVLDVAACWGFEFDPTLIAEALGVPTIPLLKRLAKIERAHRLVRASGRGFVFDHHQVQEALYETLPEILREEYHAALATALERRTPSPEGAAAPHAEDVSVALCDQYLRGARGERAVVYLDSAMQVLRRRYENARTVEMAERALAMPGVLDGRRRAEVLVRLCEGEGALSAMGRRPRQEECAREAEAIAIAIGDLALQHKASGALVGALWRTARHAEAEEAAQRSLDCALALGDRQLEADAHGNLGVALQGMSRLDEAEEHYRRLLEISEQIGHRKGAANALVHLGAVAYGRGQIDDAHTSFERALALRREDGDLRGEASSLGSLGAVDFAKGLLEEARAHHEQHLALSSRIGNRMGEAIATGNLALVLLARGRFAEAQQMAERHLTLNREIGHRVGELNATVNLGAILEAQGRLDEAREHFERYREGSVAMGTGIGESIALHNLARVTREMGDDESARALLLDSLELSEKLSNGYVSAANHLALGALGAAGANVADARPALERARELAAKGGYPAIETIALCELALAQPHSAGCAERALTAFATNEFRLDVRERCEALLLLWRLTGDRTHLENAAEQLSDMLSGRSPESRRTMVRGLRVNRAVATAAGFEEANEGPSPSTQAAAAD